MLKIYGAPHSRAFCVIWLANEIGIPYELIPVTFNVPNAQCKEPWYLALNPNGLVPAIDDGGFVMWETAAINLYLAETYKNSLYHRSRKAADGRFSGHSLRPPRSNRR
jgi:glutathione S-transferase